MSYAVIRHTVTTHTLSEQDRERCMTDERSWWIVFAAPHLFEYRWTGLLHSSDPSLWRTRAPIAAELKEPLCNDDLWPATSGMFSTVLPSLRFTHGPLVPHLAYRRCVICLALHVKTVCLVLCVSLRSHVATTRLRESSVNTPQSS